MESLENAHSPTLPSLYLRHSSFSNPSVASPTSQFIFQPFFRFSNVTRMSSIHSTTFPSLHLRHNSFSNPSVALSTSQLILKPFRCFTYAQFILQPFFRFSYVTRMSAAHSPTFPSLHLHHNSFSNPSVALPTSKVILQPFRLLHLRTVHCPTLLSLLLRHKE